MSKNPYASFVGEQDAAEMVRNFPARLSAVFAALGPAGLGRSLAPGKWTVAEILCHLADCEIAFSFRWRQALAEDDHTVQTFDQDHWATHYRTMGGEQALHAFLALRHWNCVLLDQLSPREWERPVNHPELGRLTFRSLVEITAGHDRNHLRQLEQMAENAA